MKKILVPTDFSEPSQWAVEVAVGIAKKANAEIVLIHVVEEPTKQSFNVTGEWELSHDWQERIFTRELIKKGKRDLDKLVLQIQNKGVSVSMELKMGNPFHGIRTRTNEKDIDLVVMGTYGHTRLERLFVGSNTEKVIRQAKRPVLTVHEIPRTQLYKNIVYAIGINEAETPFSEVIKIAQQLYDSTIHLVRVNTPANFMPDRIARKAMEAFVAGMNLRNYTINILNDETEEQGILYFADFVQADMIGLVTHAHSGFVHLLTGSISEGIVNDSKRPVLTYLTN